MSKIIQLNEHLANMIAAGEVVERPSSVVKELVENAIDAGASQIQIILTDSGTQEIIVKDDGCGMNRNDAKLCFSRHATSKIKNEYDLFRIQTLGFRGEAIPSIASVSTFTLTTNDGSGGTRVVYKGGHLEDISDAAHNKGTTISVKGLFYNVPARLKYLKSLPQELASITYLLSKFILANPEISFTLSNNGKIIYKTLGNGDITRIFGELYGLEVAKNLLSGSTEGHGYKINLNLVKSVISRSNKLEVTIIVNDRFVKSYAITEAIISGYHTYIPEGRYPIALVKIELDPTLVDVNVHPTKMQIKISNEDDIAKSVLSLVKNMLNQNNMIPEIKQEITKKEEKTAYIKQTIFSPISSNKLEEPHPAYNEIDSVKLNQDIPNEQSKEIELNYENKLDEILGRFDFDMKVQNPQDKIKDEIDSKIFAAKKDELPYLEYCGQVHGTYLIFQNSEGMYLIDQHAAAERINYEYYLDVLSHPTPYSQPMLIPENLSLTKSEIIDFEANISYFEELGFKFRQSGPEEYSLTQTPLWLHVEDVEDFIRNVLQGFERDKTYSIEKYRDNLAASIACKASIKANHALTKIEIDTLIEKLRQCKNPYTCPHGRPTVIKFTTLELEKLFKRVV